MDDVLLGNFAVLALTWLLQVAGIRRYKVLSVGYPLPYGEPVSPALLESLARTFDPKRRPVAVAQIGHFLHTEGLAPWAVLGWTLAVWVENDALWATVRLLPTVDPALHMPNGLTLMFHLNARDAVTGAPIGPAIDGLFPREHEPARPKEAP